MDSKGRSLTRLLLFLFTLSGVAVLVGSQATGTGQKLLLILLDGFRHDYMDQSELPLPGFHKIAQLGVRAQGFVPVFPSESYPNYYSIMTGLYTESHGMTSNYMYDVSRNESFLIGTNPDHVNPHWWDGGEPLWITAARQNKRSYMYYWRGCEVEIQGLRPNFCFDNNGSPSHHDFELALKQSLILLESGETDIAAVYFPTVDQFGHQYGPFSSELNEVIRDLDPIMSGLADRLSEPTLSEVNVMIFADHGMMELSLSRVVNISTMLQPDEYTTILDGPAVVSIYTAPGMEDQVFSKLENFHPNMTVYRTSDLPERWHIKGGPYVPPLTAVADLGWAIFPPTASESSLTKHGGHGYDPEFTEMHGIFLAMGPAFKTGVTVDRVYNTHLYQLMCNILDIQASPNNGSMSDIAPLLQTAS